MPVKTFEELWAELSEKAETRPDGSGTVRALDAGVHEIGKKLVEEAAESWMAAEHEGPERAAELRAAPVAEWFDRGGHELLIKSPSRRASSAAGASNGRSRRLSSCPWDNSSPATRIAQIRRAQFS